MMMAGTTVLRNPETGMPVVLLAGSDVPQWASELVGPHLIEPDAEQPPARPSRRPRKTD